MDKIKDLRINKNFYMYDEYIDKYARLCGIHASGVYAVLCRHSNKAGFCFPGKKLIAEKLGIGQRTVFDSIKKLEKFNIIKVKLQKRGTAGSFKCNTYFLNDYLTWRITPQAYGAHGTQKQRPWADSDNNREHYMPNKDLNNKDIKLSNENIKNIKEECNKIINEIKTKQ